jgi:hypothetical protein
MLSLPSTTLEPMTNKPLYASSFRLSQRQMFHSVLRVTHTRETDWTIAHEPSVQRFEDGQRELEQGNRMGMVKSMYARVLWKDGAGDFETRVGTCNERFELPVEDLDEATARAMEMVRQKTDGE